VVLDNAPIHTSREVKAQRPALARSGLRLVPLPPYSPDMNPIEPVFGAIKRHEMPERTYYPKEPLRAAVVRAFRNEAAKLARPRRKARKRTLTAAASLAKPFCRLGQGLCSAL
jgi:putative transposase